MSQLERPVLVDIPEVPAWPKTVGIISIVWASIGICCGGCGMAVISGMPTLMKGAEDKMGPMPPAMMPGPDQMLLGFIGLGWAVVLLTAGILCVSRRPLARPLHLIHAVVAILLGIAAVLMQVRQMGELAAWAAANPDSKWAQQMQGPGSQAGRLVGMVFGAFLSFGWPVFCIAWFAPPKRSAELAIRETFV